MRRAFENMRNKGVRCDICKIDIRRASYARDLEKTATRNCITKLSNCF